MSWPLKKSRLILPRNVNVFIVGSTDGHNFWVDFFNYL
jgi:hypothetical protein